MNPCVTQQSKYDSIVQEMGQQNFEVIRFASYRTATKLRFIQKKTNFHLVDLWNTIEAIRENKLNIYQDMMAEIPFAKLETLIASIYYNLNKRLPSSQHVNIDESIAGLLSFLTATYDPNNIGKVRVFAIKIALSTLCSGNIVDKLKYVYSLLYNSANGFVIVPRFICFLRDLMALTNSIFESSSFQYDESLPATLFDFSHPVDIETFMDLFLSSDGPPQCLSWYFIFHKIAEVEFVVHYTQCDACHRTNFTGFRYKCQKCFNYNLCQDCFWRGRSSGSHNSETHLCKEYTTWKTPSKRIGSTLRKSFRCSPSSKKAQFSDEFAANRRINLTHIVPPSPTTQRNVYSGEFQDYPAEIDSIYNRGSTLNHSHHGYPLHLTDDERHLAAHDSASADDLNEHPNDGSNILIDIAQQQQVISQLESKNREIMREITRLRQERSNHKRETREAANYIEPHHSHYTRDAILINELNALRARQEELETQLSNLSESRKELTMQLERLVQFLRNQSVPRSATSSASSSLNRGSHLTGYPVYDQNNFADLKNHDDPLSRDLLETADSVSNAMSSMVNSLHLDDGKSINENLSYVKKLENQARLKDNMIRYSSETEDEGLRLTSRRYPFHRTRDVRTKYRLKSELNRLYIDDEDIYAKTSDDEAEDETEDEIYDYHQEILSDAWIDEYLAKNNAQRMNSNLI